MSGLLPDVPYRDYQVNAIYSFLQHDPELTFSNIVLQGATGTGKTYIMKKFFEYNPEFISVWLHPIELVSWKPLMQAILRSTQQKLKQLYPDIEAQEYDPLDVEDPYQLLTLLESVLEEYSKVDMKSNLIIIFDGLDKLQDLDASVLFKLMKFLELLPDEYNIQLKFVYLIQDSSILDRYASCLLPTIVFPRYTVDEVTEILILTRTNDLINSDAFRNCILTQVIDNCDDDQFCKVAMNFITLIIQAFHPYTGNDIDTLNDLIDFKWDQYIEQITKENILDPVALYRSTSKIFISTEDNLGDDDNDEDVGADEENNGKEVFQTYELSTISKYLLIAAYICSYLEARYDSSVFSKKSNIKSGRISYGRRKKKEVNPRYLAPSIFSLERLFAVFQAIYPVEFKTESGTLSSLREDKLIKANMEVFQNLAELHSLKLVATAVTKNIDFLSPKVKWKVNVPWEIINEISESVKFDLGLYFSNLHD
ncbi:hypothetical protein Kpol_2000p53 [Vanderwaltozyma polyspora DSM 70294]|uniref:Uncharacterized protein n=1 Tax=Vanderwaltozyma polyspora (strain ATCC 22028 / DSM 70294 / BCRC 21397 / CBS 2163 / NBRC 10782 / NRRL Y-8283 / UCD 57-17) TaxID=436907 RepID=A7TF61_VANPO|nr:uncharacterized protein Kpol_2000p53 [Vanderwaltozyma polyspora DSM 70294]EDO19086.1 hypothetical protein Kpol_2000p53 [Vanderwaltozyma polyspora DSM 70294]